MTDGADAETWRPIPLQVMAHLARAPKPADPPLVAAVVIWVGPERYQISAEDAHKLSRKIELAARDAEISRTITGGYPGGDEYSWWRQGVLVRNAHHAACRGCAVCDHWRGDPAALERP